jgi:hypothetical protein
MGGAKRNSQLSVLPITAQDLSSQLEGSSIAQNIRITIKCVDTI